MIIFLLFLAFRVSAATLYVSLNSTNPVPPYADWATAADNIQDAIDASTNGDLVLVSNGVYQTGGRVVYGSLTNRVVISGAITVQSVNGPLTTLIQGNSVLGNSAVRCVFMSTNSILAGFTLTNGGTLSSGDYHVDESGGGVWTTNNSAAIVSNCVLIGNVAQGMGGGEYNGNIYGCSIIQNHVGEGGGFGCEGLAMVMNSSIAGNSAATFGGGVESTVMINCSVLQNAAAYGGGAEYCSLYGCLVVSNVAGVMGGGLDSCYQVRNCTIANNRSSVSAGGITGAFGPILNTIIYNNIGWNGNLSNYDQSVSSRSPNNCCMTPMPAHGTSNITNDPLFIDPANGNFRLQTNSPCINSGNNSYESNNIIGKLSTDWTETHVLSAARRTLALMNTKALPQVFPTPGSSNMACRLTVRWILPIWMVLDLPFIRTGLRS